MLQLPPLSLYIHIPWCIEKCPYCDFNSHKLQGTIPEEAYLSALINDLKIDLVYAQGRILDTIFIGGGTPSLISAKGIAWLLSEIRNLIAFKKDIEITLEANPGTIENSKIADFKEAGISRFSFGVQSFQNDKLQRLGRIHNADEAIRAAKHAKKCAIKTFNLDLMHGLPDQSLSDALSDLQCAIDLQPTHISWYQLTIEPNTQYFSHPPILPEDDLLWDIQEAGQALLAENGYIQYEISGYSKKGFECQHNLNYWSFSDYIGIGCGAHGKLTLPLQNKIVRTVKVKHPKGYLQSDRAFLDKYEHVARDELAFEYMLNRLRLFVPIPFEQFESYTGLSLDSIDDPINQAVHKKLLVKNTDHWLVTDLGHRYLNDLLALFM
ncbi:putative oxygen-independent coproporphyrinogen III oxidase [Psychromonas sp. CNPT3]|uniref:radical SAM family heme chaperone HemW n=1 Tax=Psychromonas sp. CNPT3 TaxID=314282 RepID=UPI00006E9556|nr:radical SAM family heme chaperone HemW [Psychromonas sp. CNPT3]AGH80252.1 putative oxygen-independent coproporphyrinogen III oxidase [Psychromonas sp. CNPT3]